ncbi:acyl-CoA thioesterase/bile acid-CoA:amino acid N-acyltransferase family protein [Brevibacillus ginsengisoli]|uniref:acyl-CoA thioesterase/bile acid-CoA:amino acid N-acyltransferase family protein n=1 Tax=Brevibacillus ginsengisoli TaxID=363854 RepID=UPI003CF8E3AF
MKTTQPAILVSHTHPLIDEKLDITITGLQPSQLATIRMRETGVPGGVIEGHSHAVFEADETGHIHVSRQKPLSGTYGDVHPMGLFWSQEVQKIQFNRSPKIDEIPFEPRFSTVELTVEVDQTVIASNLFTRNFISPDIQIKNIHDNGLVAKFFSRPDSVSSPGIIVVGGSEGGLVQPSIWAALFASHGYPSLALAYFQSEDLPDDITNIPLEYIEKAIGWLQQQETVDAGKIAMFGRSKGAELSLVSGATFSSIKAVIAISPTSVVSIGSCPCGNGDEHQPESSWSYQGEPLPFVSWTREQCQEALQNIRRMERFDHIHRATLDEHHLVEAATIPVEKINGPILLVSSDDDHYWPADWHCEQMVKRLKERNFPHAVTHLNYPDVGHGIRYPYIQTTLLCMNGGTAYTNALASEHSYRKVLEFLQETFQE